MATRQQTNHFDAEFAALAQQVMGIEKDYRDTKVAIVNLDKKIDNSFSVLAAKIDAQAKFPWNSLWAALAVVLTGMTVVGWMAMAPIQANQIRLENALAHEQALRRDIDKQERELRIGLGKRLSFIEGYLTAKDGFHAPR